MYAGVHKYTVYTCSIYIYTHRCIYVCVYVYMYISCVYMYIHIINTYTIPSTLPHRSAGPGPEALPEDGRAIFMQTDVKVHEPGS